MKILMILAPMNFRDEEYIEPRKELERKNAVVMTASATEISHGTLGATVTNDLLLTNVNLADFDGIFWVGGTGCLDFWDDPIAQKLAGDFVAADKPVGAICAAPRLLLHWGFLKNKKMTGWNGDDAVPHLAETGEATYIPDAVVVDGKFLTADGPTSATSAGKKFFDLCLHQHK